MTLPVIDEHTDLDAAICDLRADQAELQRREQLINGEANRRTYEIHRQSVAAQKAEVDAVIQKRVDAHEELVRLCRSAKKDMEEHDAAVLKAQGPVRTALDSLERANGRVAAHKPLNERDSLAEERATWNEIHGKLQAEVRAQEAPYFEVLEKFKTVQVDRESVRQNFART